MKIYLFFLNFYKIYLYCYCNKKTNNMTVITIDDVRNLAKKKGLKIVVKEHLKYNEFTIFIYDKRIQSRYLVGYDGSHSGNWVSWNDCCKMSYDYIIKNYGND